MQSMAQTIVILNLDVAALVAVVWKMLIRQTFVLLPGTLTSFRLPVVLVPGRFWIAGSVNDKFAVFRLQVVRVLGEAN